MATNFDERARTWDDDPAKVERAEAVAAAIRDAVPLSPHTRLLEYGAGTGLVTQALTQALPDPVADVTLADPSSGMREVMAAKVADGRLPASTRVLDLDLATASVPNAEFDLIVTVMTLHHIPDLQPVLDGFRALLSDGGWVAIVDLEAEDGSFHSSDPDFDGHRGFARDDLTRQLEAAGFHDLTFDRCHQMVKEGRTYPLFLVTGRAREQAQAPGPREVARGVEG